MNKEQSTKIVQVLNEQGFLALDDNITLDVINELVQSLFAYPVREVLEYLNDNGHLCIDNDQFDEVLKMVESI